MKDYAFYRNRLPHINFDRAIQFVSFRLYDSLPVSVCKADQGLRERTLDECLGRCLLADPHFAQIVQEVLLCSKYNYKVIAYVIMPNHVHVLVQIEDSTPLWKIIKSWKAVSAIRINKILNLSGPLWAKDYFDHYMRNEFHLSQTIEYIHENPVKAGRCFAQQHYKFSSAFRGGMGE